ncbi:MAG: hypothetical protein Q7R62_02895 [bacterium]|nr:hypothetical protein [bacterium]
MRIIPVINCQDFDEVKERFHIAQEILFGTGSESREIDERDGWIHIDIADGGFTKGYSTWRNPQEFSQLKRNPHLKIEVHIMMSEPEEVISEWLALGVHRIIFHLESVANVETITGMCAESGVETMLALKPETPVAHAFQYLPLVNGCQLLAVTPGPANQQMAPHIIEKLEALHAQHPDLLIEIDGGINPETAQQCAKAGASQVVSGSYIFHDDNPAAAYQRLQEI